MAPRKFVLFDFDGVIADTWKIALETAQIVFPSFEEKNYRQMFEGNVFESHSRLAVNPDGRRESDVKWFDIYVPKFEEHAALFPGVRNVIEKLSHRYILIIISSTLTSPIQGFLEKHHIGRYFSEVMGADVHTSKHEKIKMIFQKYGTTASECIFVTDTLGDMLEAKKENVGAIGVSWGFHPRETLAKGDPFRIVDTPAEIPAAISDYFGKPVH
ncbi:HAD family hydrolase [Candidatus Kaiserbacteria bacterium]|nr:HAD family hydrolase [Candidatus Kaiserbacteria bacterium]